jgi:hypothetical protein
MSPHAHTSFDDLKNWPGRRAPVNRPAEGEEVSSDEDGWDTKPVVYIHGGQSREFFTISHLSHALNRSPVTIRSWENKGVLPKSPFRSPAPRRSTVGSTPKGKRLWTRDQIEGIIQIAKETGCILDEKQSPPNSKFTVQVTQLFIDIVQRESGK